MCPARCVSRGSSAGRDFVHLLRTLCAPSSVCSVLLVAYRPLVPAHSPGAARIGSSSGSSCGRPPATVGILHHLHHSAQVSRIWMAGGRGASDQNFDRMAPIDAVQPRSNPEVHAAPPEHSSAPYLEQQPSVFDLLSPGVLSLPTARHSRAAIVACQVKKTSSSCWSGSRRATEAAAAPKAVSGGQSGRGCWMSGAGFLR